MNGVVKWFNDVKGYGFIRGEDGTEVFIHYSAILMTGRKTLAESQCVSYDTEETSRGIQAINVVLQQ